VPRHFPYRQLRDHFEGIPTVREWQSLTTIKTFGIFTHSRKNPDLLSIDRALEEFDKSEATPFDDSKESAEAKKTRARITALLLLGIAKACMVWMEHKAQTDSSNRRKYVANLAMNAQQAADSLGLDLKFTGPPAKGGKPPKQSEIIGSTAAKLRWQMARDAMKHLGVGKDKKALDSHYWLETNIGGSNPQHIQGADFGNAFGRSGEKFAFNFARKNPQDLDSKVKYVTPENRWRYQIIVTGGLMYRRTSAVSTASGDLVLLDTGGTGYIFIIDDKANLYCSMGEQPDGLLFHHSSIMNGVAVTFAGAIDVAAGKLTGIDNASGHYRPGKDHLLNALAILNKCGVPLKGVKITFLAGMRKVEDMELPDFKAYSDAQSYLESKGTVAPG
jgi:hypothetical protein